MKATFEPAAAEPKRRKRARKAAEPKKAVAEPRRRKARKARVAAVYAEPRRAAPKRRRRRAAEPAPAFVFEPRRAAAPKRRRAAPRRLPARSMGYAFEPALTKEERMRNLAMGWYRKQGTVPPHLVQYLPAGYETMAPAALPAARRRAGRPRKSTAGLKHPRKTRKPTGAPKGKRGRPRLPTVQLKHPRKATPAKRRTTATRKRRTTSSALARGRYQRVVPVGQYKSAQTGQVIAIRRVFGKRNPAFETKHIVAGVGGLVLGIVGADLLDRFIATMAPSGSNTPLTDMAAIAAIRSKANAARMGTSAGGAVVGFGTAYLLRHKSPTASYALGGFGLGFGVKFLTQLVTDVIMPVVFKVQNRTTDTTANRLYPDKQGYADQTVTPTPVTTTPPANPPAATPGTNAGVGRVRDMRRPNIYRLPAPVRAGMPMQQQRQMVGNRAMPDFGPRATRPMARPGVMGVGCGGSCGNQSCAPSACHYPFENYQTGPESVPQGTQFIPSNVMQPITDYSNLSNQGTNQPSVQTPGTATDGTTIPDNLVVQVDTLSTPNGPVITQTPIGTTSGPRMSKDQIQRMMANAAAKRTNPYSHFMRR